MLTRILITLQPISRKITLIFHLQLAHSSCSVNSSRCGRSLLSLLMNCWVRDPTAQLRPAQRLFPFRFQVRPSSLATAPIRQSCHLSGCQLIIMIFQLHSALNLDQGLCRFPTRTQHKEARGRQAQVRPPSPAGQHGEAPPSMSILGAQGPGPK